MNRLGMKLLFTALLFTGAPLAEAQAAAHLGWCENLVSLEMHGKLTPKLIFEVPNAQTCLAREALRLETLGAGKFSAKDILPQSSPLISAFKNYQNSQQTSAAPSTASSSPVSKPAGPTALIQEFGGLQINSASSSTTFQFAPGQLLYNLQNSAAVPICNTDLDGITNCLPTKETRFWLHWTFAASAQTSSASQTATGTVGGTLNQAVNFITGSGSNYVSFAGATVKYALFQPAKLTESAQSIAAAQKQGDFFNALNNGNCDAYTQWQENAATAYKNRKASAPDDAAGLLSVLHSQYQALLGRERENNPCIQAGLGMLPALLSDELRADLADDLRNELQATDTPWLGLEYDLSTPSGKPSFSSVKLNLSHTFGKKAVKALSLEAAGETQKDASATSSQPTKTDVVVEKIVQNTCAQATVTDHLNKENGADGSPLNNVCALANTRGLNTARRDVQRVAASQALDVAAKQAAADDTPPWTVNVSLVADVFNSSQTSIAPTASRLRDFQGGAEIDYKVPLLKHWKPTSGAGQYLLTNIGDPTLAASYVYQDQTSPSILSGPPSTVTFVGLPTTASSVYTTRGPIHLAQFRAGFGNGTNLKFPVAFTYSNRSELVPGRVLGFQVGFSYNLSGLGSSAKN